jgi:LuxR family transcriptional regulator, maltose regulon positive regulatory protein
MSGPASPILIHTKLFPPQQAGRTIVRARLLERLRDGSGRRELTLIAAPAGYGKTILLSDWAKTEVDRPVAWMSIDDRDDDPVVLWAHIIESLRQVSSGPCRSLSPELASSASLTEIVMPRIINALSDEGDIALVLDDFHRLSARASTESVAWLVARAPNNLQLVVATRSEPDLPLPAMRVHGQLLEIRAEDLRFTQDEAAAWLNDEAGLQLSWDEIGTLMRRTEGWPAGLYLAALSMPRAADAHEFIVRFGASSRYVAEFLMTEVLDTYEPDLQTFMLHTSVLREMSAPLCDAVRGEDDSGAVLLDIARSNLFLVALDDTGTWYRFHHLFSQLLRAELDRREPRVAPSLHRRAFGWFLENGRFEEAIDHAIEAEAFDEAGDVIAATWPLALNACKFETIHGWLRRIPVRQLEGDARLLIAEAWGLCLSGRSEEAEKPIAAIQALPRSRSTPLLDGFSSVESSLALLRAYFSGGDVGAMLESALRAMDLEDEGSPWRPTVHLALGLGHYFAGDPQEADRWFAECARSAAASDQWLAGASSLAFRSLVAAAQGRDTDRRNFAEEGAQLARDHRLEALVGELSLALAVSKLEDGLREGALDLAEEGTAILRAWGQPLDLAHALLHVVSVARTIGNYGRASSALEEARALVDSCPDPGMLLTGWLAQLTPSSDRHEASEGDALTERELVVLRLLRGSLSEREIGNELYLSYNTVHSHTRSIYKKLGATSRARALEVARSRGLI